MLRLLVLMMVSQLLFELRLLVLMVVSQLLFELRHPHLRLPYWLPMTMSTLDV